MSGRQLKTVPESIGNLTNLTSLYLRWSQLKTIPESISNLTNLKLLYLDNNPLEEPPVEIAKQGIQAIRDYFRNRKHQERIINKKQNLTSIKKSMIYSNASYSLEKSRSKISNIFYKLPSFNYEPDKKELKELLIQLQGIVLESNLYEKEAEETLKQIQIIAEALQNPQDSEVKKAAKRAMIILRRIAAALPPSSPMVTICNQLQKLISRIFVG